MNKFQWSVISSFVVALLLLPLVSGCSDQYPEDLVFPVRDDPILMQKIVLQEEPSEPDRPGQLPLGPRPRISYRTQLLDPRNPYNHVFEVLAAERGESGDIMQVADEYLRDPTKISADDKAVFQETLDAMFGTPTTPYIAIPKAKESTIEKLKLDEETLARGSELYRLQCLQCHGLTGNGRGPTALWVNPHPRDYRQGQFKFQSVNQADGVVRKPMRSDLLRTLTFGVEGTSMPAFNLLPEEDLEALVSYVIFLSIRGEAEFQTFKSLVYNAEEDLLTPRPRQSIEKTLQDLALVALMDWASAEDNPINAVPYPKYSDEELKASVLRGQALFLGRPDLLLPLSSKKDGEDEAAFKKRIGDVAKAANCISCHLDYGRRSLWKFDDWGTLVRPVDLTVGIYRGGRRPIDMYWRIHSGIVPSGMANFGSSLDGTQIWDLVNYLQALPYPAMRQKYGLEISQ